MNVGDKYTVEHIDEATGAISLKTYQVVRVEGSIIEAVEVFN